MKGPEETKTNEQRADSCWINNSLSLARWLATAFAFLKGRSSVHEKNPHELRGSFIQLVSEFAGPR